METALNFAKDFIKNNPEHTEEVQSFYSLMMSEIEEGNDWKYTEILYCKLDWCKDMFDWSDDLLRYLEIITEVQIFIEKLQKFENERKAV
jgi:hypothetical protein